MTIHRSAFPLSGPVFGGEIFTLERILLRVEGVVVTLVDPATEMAYVEYDPERVDPASLSAVIEQAGFAPVDSATTWWTPPSVRGDIPSASPRREPAP